MSDTAKTELKRDDLLFLRLVRGFRRADAERKRSIIEEVTTLRARYRTTPEPPLGGSLSPTDFHRAIWPTEIVGRDPWGHLIVVERVKDVDFDRLLEMPIDAVLRLRVQAHWTRSNACPRVRGSGARTASTSACSSATARTRLMLLLRGEKRCRWPRPTRA